MHIVHFYEQRDAWPDTGSALRSREVPQLHSAGQHVRHLVTATQELKLANVLFGLGHEIEPPQVLRQLPKTQYFGATGLRGVRFHDPIQVENWQL